MNIVDSHKDDDGFYMRVEPADDPALAFTVQTGRGLSDSMYDDYMSVMFFRMTPEHYERLLQGFPIEEITQVSFPLGAPQRWNVFLQKDMTLEEMSEVKHGQFRLDITLRDDGSAFEDMAPLIIGILETIREDFLSPEVYIHYNDKYISFHSAYVNTKTVAVKDLPTVDEVKELIVDAKSSVE